MASGPTGRLSIFLVAYFIVSGAAAAPLTSTKQFQFQAVSVDRLASESTADLHVFVEGSNQSHQLQKQQQQQNAGSTAAPHSVFDTRAAAAAAGAVEPQPHNSMGAPGASDKPAPKPLWPLDGIDVAVLIIMMFSLSLAGGAGIGGGAILVPVFLMLRGWPTAIAVALSNVTILGGSFANFICNVTRHRPNGKRTIDWELILMMEPTTIAGALIGAVANKLLPNWIITYLLAILLTLMALRLFSKGKQTYAKETQLLLAATAAAKERRSDRLRALSITRGHSSSTAQHDAARPRRSAEFGGVAVRSSSKMVQRSNSALSRSMSRLRGSLVIAAPAGSALPSPASILSPACGSALVSPAARLLHAGDAGASSSARRSMEQTDQDESVERYIQSIMFQGDVPDDTHAIVALPASEDLSSLPSSDYEDVEAPDETPEGSPDLLQPLLAKKQEAAADAAAAADDDLCPQGDQCGCRAAGQEATADATITLDRSESLPKPAVREPCLPWPHFLTLVGLSGWVVAADIAQDSFRCGSWQYWASQLSVLIPVVVILGACRQVLLRKYRHDELPPGTQPAEGELHWTRRTTILYPLLCSSAGLIAGLFGIGGGVVKGPLMLELGVPPDVAAATSATMIMFTAGSACLVYSRFGQILYDYAAVLLVLGFLVTLCSQLLTFVLIKLLGRRSIIVFMMVALMAVATCIMYIQSYLVTSDLIHHPEDLWRFGSLCPAHNRLKLLGQLLMRQLW